MYCWIKHIPERQTLIEGRRSILKLAGYSVVLLSLKLVSDVILDIKDHVKKAWLPARKQDD
jgi:hypothetical protein